MSDYETLTLEVADFVATVTINRPPVNAQNNRFREEIAEVIEHCLTQAASNQLPETVDGIVAMDVDIRRIAGEFIGGPEGRRRHA